MYRGLPGFIVAFVLCVSTQAQAFAQSPLTSQGAEAARRQIRHDLYVPDTLPALEAKTWSTFAPASGVLADRVTYTTQDGMLVPAIVYRPDSQARHWNGKLPGIVIVNGHGGDKFSWYAFYSGMMLAKAGAVVLTYDPIGEGERNAERRSMSKPSPHDVYPPTPDGMTDEQWHRRWGPHVAGLMQVDLAQAVRYLRAKPEVDPWRIATVGYSMGAFIAGIEGAWDTNVYAVLLSGGGVYDGPGQYYDSSKLPCQGPAYQALSNLGDRGPMLFALHALRGPEYIMNGSDDAVMDIPHHGPSWFAAVRAEASALLANTPAARHHLFTTIFYPGISHRTSWVNRDGIEWLNRHLHFAFWNTDAKIEAAGTTHISTWIKANDVAISPNYLREDREGGLDAVGTGLPGIARADLMVLPDADWHMLESRLTWQRWQAGVLPALACLLVPQYPPTSRCLMSVALDAKDTTPEQVFKHAASGDEVRLTSEGRAIATVRTETVDLFAPAAAESRERMRAGLARADERSKRLVLKVPRQVRS